jgi:hypothetical protein
VNVTLLELSCLWLLRFFAIAQAAAWCPDAIEMAVLLFSRQPSAAQEIRAERQAVQVALLNCHAPEAGVPWLLRDGEGAAWSPCSSSDIKPPATM